MIVIESGVAPSSEDIKHVLSEWYYELHLKQQAAQKAMRYVVLSIMFAGAASVAVQQAYQALGSHITVLALAVIFVPSILMLCKAWPLYKKATDPGLRPIAERLVPVSGAEVEEFLNLEHDEPVKTYIESIAVQGRPPLLAELEAMSALYKQQKERSGEA